MDGDTELYFLSISGCGWGHLIIFCILMIRKYHSHKTLRETLLKLESDFPDIAEVDIFPKGNGPQLVSPPGLLHRDKC